MTDTWPTTETPTWRRAHNDLDDDLYAATGLGVRLPAPSAPALLVVDCTLAFSGPRDATFEDAVAAFATACGPVSWPALDRVADLLAAFRAADRPIAFTRSDLRLRELLGGATKMDRLIPFDRQRTEAGNVFVAPAEPLSTDMIIEKTRASAFFSTPLAVLLHAVGVDGVVVVGSTTSGCIRATAVDAFSHGFLTFVAADACFDRSQAAHDANLADLDAKYATVFDTRALHETVGLPLPG